MFIPLVLRCKHVNAINSLIDNLLIQIHITKHFAIS